LHEDALPKIGRPDRGGEVTKARKSRVSGGGEYKDEGVSETWKGVWWGGSQENEAVLRSGVAFDFIA
jgi:hypothetical protein